MSYRNSYARLCESLIADSGGGEEQKKGAGPNGPTPWQAERPGVRAHTSTETLARLVVEVNKSVLCPDD